MKVTKVTASQLDNYPAMKTNRYAQFIISSYQAYKYMTIFQRRICPIGFL